MPLRHWLQLALTDGIGPILSRRIIDAAAGDAQAACSADLKLLRDVEGIGNARANRIQAALRHASTVVDAELARASSAGVQIICPDDESVYPVLLRTIPDPPVVLYMRGSFEPRDLNALAIVGSRRCTYYGREQAERFAALLANAGYTVVSGGARGVDSAAHRGAFSHPNGRTIAVLGSGVDVPYPPENAGLFEQIAQRGAVVSEFPLGTPPNKENFPRRNRIVSGMSRGVVVVEADSKSGALITARQAVEDHGRPVFAVPGRVDNPQSAGPHKLIREGAVLIETLDDIVNALDPLPQEAVESSVLPSLAAMIGDAPPPSPLFIEGLSERQQAILSELGSDSANVDLLAERTSLPAHVVLQELTFLSLKGRVKRVGGQTYIRQTSIARA